jgi:ATP-dependent RNA helicase DeaD
MKAITELGYEKPTPIQAQALPILLGEPLDFIGLAATGTGKTAAFGIPLIEKIDASKHGVQGLILCPTRELALQVSGQLNLIGKYKGVKAVPIYGGASYGDQIRGVKTSSIVVGTPGRVLDHIERNTLPLRSVTTVILDEADEMISMGFKEDLEAILKNVPRELSRTWLFSATMDRNVRKIADYYLREPRHVQVNRDEMLSTTVEQIFYVTKESNKREILAKIIDSAQDFYGLVFCQTKAIVTELSQFLLEQGYKVDSLHGDKDQRARERTLNNFRERNVNILVCTDVASRGLDVKDISHVVNYSIPRELESYVHRIGRTARSGKAGLAISLVTPANRSLIPRIERMTRSQMREGKIPTRKDVGSKKITEIFSRFQKQQDYSKALELLDDNWKKEIAEMSREAIVSKFLMLTFSSLFDDSKKVQPLTPIHAPRPRHETNRWEGNRSGGGRRGSRFGQRRSSHR